MSITKGRPVSFTAIFEAIADNYPDIAVVLESLGVPSTETPAIGMPFRVNVTDDETPASFSYMKYAVGMAMLCPPNSDVWSETISGPDGTYSISSVFRPPDNIIGVTAYLNIPDGSHFATGTTMLAPDIFVDLESADFTDPNSLSDSINDSNLQIDAYVAANPDKLVLVTWQTGYTSSGVPSHSITRAKIGARIKPS